jgi:hypothetical protein
MTRRERLPDRRLSESFTFEHLGLRFDVTVSRYADGRVAEVFLSNHKADSQIGGIVRDAAIILSFGLQYGVPLDAVRKAVLRDPRGSASTPLGVAIDIIATSRGSS